MKFPSCHVTLGAQDLMTSSLNLTFVTIWVGSKWRCTGYQDGSRCIIRFYCKIATRMLSYCS